jgi:CRP/FNR family transcriptional regulator, cyclic AMP receptor protein
MPDPSSLREIALFRDLSSDQLSWINNHLHVNIFPAGRHIVNVEELGETVYIILEGTVKVYLNRSDGTEVILAILGSGDTVGELSLLDSTGRSANVVTMEKSTLLRMDRTTFWESLQKIPAMNLQMVHVVCDRLRVANEQVKALATLDIPSRIARQILAIAQKFGQVATNGDILIPVPLTQSDIAGLVGAVRESVNPVIVEYKRLKYISVDTHYRITIHNKEALIQRCLE